MSYNERFMHSQTDWRWGWRKLTPWSRTMKEIGCLLTCFAYIISRHDGVDITPGKFLDWIAGKARENNWTDYLTPDGRAYFNSVDRFTLGTIQHTYNKEDKKYTLVQVNWGGILHWMVELSGGLVFNPYGYKVELLNQKKWYQTGRREYYKITTPAKT